MTARAACLLAAATALVLSAAGCPGGGPAIDMGNTTGEFVGAQEGWTQCRVTLHDSFGLGGYKETVLDGSRRGAERAVEKFWREERHDLELAEGDVAALVRKCVEVDVLALDDTTGPPDGAFSRLTLRNPAGDEKQVVIYDAGGVPEAFEKAAGAVRALGAAARRTSAYDGDYQENAEFPGF